MNTPENEMTEDEAEEAIMGFEVTGKLPPHWTRGTLTTAYLIIGARQFREDYAEIRDCNEERAKGIVR